MPLVAASHIFLDEHGVAWIANTTTKVIEVIIDQAAFVLTPSQIHAEHPHLSLAQVYAALSYYYDHKRELDNEIASRYTAVEELRRERNGASPTTKQQFLDRRQKLHEQAAG